MCQHGDEDIKHLLFTCDRAKAIWNTIGIIWGMIASLLGIDQSGSIVLEEIIRRGERVGSLDISMVELVLVGSWYIWWERRQYTHGETIQQA